MATDHIPQATRPAARTRMALALTVVLVLAATLGMSRPASALHASPRTTGVQAVDLYNDVAYSLNGMSVEVVDGTGTFRLPWYDVDSTFTINGHLYGDVSGDGLTDAAVWASYTETGPDGSTIKVDGVWVVYLDPFDNQPQVAGPTWYGTNAYGGLEYVEVRDGYLAVSIFGGNNHCCPTQVSETRWILGNGYLVPAERMPSVTYVDLSGHAAAGVVDVIFPPDSSSAVIESHPQRGADSFTFEAAARQSIQMQHRWGQADVRISRLDTGAVIGTLTDNQVVNVPVDGRYLAQVQPSPVTLGQASFELTIASARRLHSPTWVPRAFFEDSRFEDSQVDITTHWPEITSANPAVDLDKVNDLISGAIDAEVASFRTAVARQSSTDQRSTDQRSTDQRVTGHQDSGLWIDYEFSLVAYDLVSLDLRINRRLCCTDSSPNSTFERRTMVIDINRARLLDLDDLITPTHKQDLAATWWEAVQSSRPSLVKHGHVNEPAAGEAWRGAIVRSNGISLLGSTSEGGALEALLTWDRLAAIGQTNSSSARTNLAFRAGSSRALPISMDGCGC